MDDSAQITAVTSVRGFSQPLRVVLWGSPLLTCGAWLTQWHWRFPSPSPGASLTATAFALGALIWAISTLCALYRLVRSPPSRSLESYFLAGLGLALLLLLGLSVAGGR